MDQPTQPASSPNSARRKLIRGSFSVPAVLAVHNGSALAGTSNDERCAINGTNGTAVFPAAVTVADGYKRVTKYFDSASGKSFIQVSDLQAVATVSGTTFVAPTGTATGWVRYVTGGTYTYSAPTGTPTATTTLVAVLFDSNGVSPVIRVVGFVQPSQTTAPAKTSALTGSCWASMQP